MYLNLNLKINILKDHKNNNQIKEQDSNNFIVILTNL